MLRFAILSLLLSCSPNGTAPPTGEDAAAPTPPAPSADTPPAGWGAVFWRDGQAWQLGGGPAVVGPRGQGLVTEAIDRERWCGGTPIEGAPEHALLAPPVDATVAAPGKPPANPAPVVEAASWRLDEALPARDRFSTPSTDPDPARQRGVELGSLVKARQYGAPPFLIAAGTRECTGVLGLLNADASVLIDHITIPDSCSLPHALAPHDLDGDGDRETAFFTGDRVVLIDIIESTAGPSLTLVGGWHCPTTPATP